MSEEKDYYGESTAYVTRWNYPEGHNHPSGGIINPKQQLILASLKTMSAAANEVKNILDNMDKPMKNGKGEVIFEKVGEDYRYELDSQGQPSKKVQFDIMQPKIQNPRRTSALSDDAILGAISEFCDWLTDYSVAIGGVGRLGANKAINRTKGYDEQEEAEKERGRIAKFFLGPKKTQWEKAL